MADFDEMVRDAVKYSLSVKVECLIDDDGDKRVRVKLSWDDRVISESEDYFDGTGAKDHDR